MKLKEKLAIAHASNEPHPASEYAGFLAGFQKSKELICSLLDYLSLGELADIVAQLGDEEVQDMRTNAERQSDNSHYVN